LWTKRQVLPFRQYPWAKYTQTSSLLLGLPFTVPRGRLDCMFPVLFSVDAPTRRVFFLSVESHQLFYLSEIVLTLRYKIQGIFTIVKSVNHNKPPCYHIIFCRYPLY
jgi:hypothetical protein